MENSIIEKILKTAIYILQRDGFKHPDNYNLRGYLNSVNQKARSAALFAIEIYNNISGTDFNEHDFN